MFSTRGFDFPFHYGLGPNPLALNAAPIKNCTEPQNISNKEFQLNVISASTSKCTRSTQVLQKFSMHSFGTSFCEIFYPILLVPRFIAQFHPHTHGTTIAIRESSTAPRWYKELEKEPGLEGRGAWLATHRILLRHRAQVLQYRSTGERCFKKPGWTWVLVESRAQVETWFEFEFQFKTLFCRALVGA